MSGHSKWSTIKHQKGAKDAKRGKLFARLIRAIEIAARTGGANPDGNPTLADAIQKAKDNSVPNDTIDRAVKRGAGELEGQQLDLVTYEGYAPGGVAVLVEAAVRNQILKLRGIDSMAEFLARQSQELQNSSDDEL